MTNINSEFHSNFRRLTRGQTGAEVAARIGVDPSTVSRYLAGKREPDLNRLRLIVLSYDTSADELLGLKEAA